ncbi:hypothetical protein DQ354_17865 [Arthrobacter sp. AQ5-06]|nr:hypothetical protein DQ354_17865 [Arthrobacter sp. AQ5-06]
MHPKNRRLPPANRDSFGCQEATVQTELRREIERIRTMTDITEWAEIRRLHIAEGLSVREIANRLGIARKTVDRALANEQPAKYPVKRRPAM